MQVRCAGETQQAARQETCRYADAVLFAFSGKSAVPATDEGRKDTECKLSPLHWSIAPAALIFLETSFGFIYYSIIHARLKERFLFILHNQMPRQ